MYNRPPVSQVWLEHRQQGCRASSFGSGDRRPYGPGVHRRVFVSSVQEHEKHPDQHPGPAGRHGPHQVNHKCFTMWQVVSTQNPSRCWSKESWLLFMLSVKVTAYSLRRKRWNYCWNDYYVFLSLGNCTQVTTRERWDVKTYWSEIVRNCTF